MPSDQKASAISSAVSKGDSKVQSDTVDVDEQQAIDFEPDTVALKLQIAQFLEQNESLPAVKPDEFEKDDDTNYHVDFLHALTNLRARNYGLAEYDWLQVKIKAGRIIPALVTTTAVVSGLVAIQLIQTVAGAPVELLKNSFVNLAVPYVAQSEPGAPKQRKLGPEVCNSV